MTPERWQQAKQLFHLALDRAPGERSAFLTDACGDDAALRQEVESLISAHEKEGGFIDAPAYEVVAELLVDQKSNLKPGQAIGAYEIISFISRGGMGEVYLAQDLNLSRKVALKILPASFMRDSDRLQRFEQEARSASALNHPNIITIYEILKTNSTHVIATEFVEGETLRQRLSRSTLSLTESLKIAIQIAAALTAAHTAGIIHRDIKPDNLMLRPDGYVKVLDFGLAKLAEPASPLLAAEAPTKKIQTASGMIMGTIGYMSPEQARGLAIDTRTDIFSLGAVIYEMVAHRKPFDGETPGDMLAAILRAEPALLSHFAPDAPPELVRIVTKALRKDREERYQVVKDMLLDLKSIAQDLDFQDRLKQTAMPETRAASAGSQTVIQTRMATVPRTDEIDNASTTLSSAAPNKSDRRRLWPIVAVIALVLTGASFGVYDLIRKQTEKKNPIAAPIVTNLERITSGAGLDSQPALSPDGNSVAYSSDHNGSFEIYVKQLTPGGRENQLTSDGQGNFQPAWSPDGQRIAYYSKNRGGIWIVPTSGGAARQLSEFGSSPAWSHDASQIAFQSDPSSALADTGLGLSTIWIVSAEGGAARQITKSGNPGGGHTSPTWSPDNRRIAFVDLHFSNQEIWSVSVAGEDLKQMPHVKGRAGSPVYSPDGHSLYFVIGPVVWMLPISPESGGPTADAVKVTDAVASFITNPTLSADGKRMAYSVQTVTGNLWSVPVSGDTNVATGFPHAVTNQTGARYSLPAFSLDGRKLAFVAYLRAGVNHILVADADGKNPEQVTTPNIRSIGPSWFPDGDQIALLSYRDNRFSVWATSLKTRRERVLLDIGRDIEYARLSPDGKQVVFNQADGGVINIWTASVPGGQPKQLTFDKELAGFPSWSPDGKFIAYQLKRGDDAYVMVMPSGGGESTQLNFDHGRSWPYSWSPDGDKIVFAGERNGLWNVWWVSRSTKQQKQLTNYTKLIAFVRYPAWSPSGDQIVYEYSETSGNIWLMELK